MFAVCCQHKSALPFNNQSQFLHEAAYTISTYLKAFFAQLLHHAAAAHAFSGLGKVHLDSLTQMPGFAIY